MSYTPETLREYALGADGSGRDLPPDDGWWCREESGPVTIGYVVYKGQTRVAEVRYSYVNHVWHLVDEPERQFLTLDRAPGWLIESVEGV